jgi:hypothetical protein
MFSLSVGRPFAMPQSEKSLAKRLLPNLGIVKQSKVGTKVAIYKYHTNEFVYKNEGVGAMAEQSDQIGKIFTQCRIVYFG